MGTLWQKCKKTLGVTTLVSEINCVVDHAKLPNLVIVAVVSFIYLWRKMKAFQPLEEHTGEIQFEWIHVVDFDSLKPSFTLKIVQNRFGEHQMATMVEFFAGAVVKKTLFCYLPMFRISLFLVGK